MSKIYEYFVPVVAVVLIFQGYVIMTLLESLVGKSLQGLYKQSLARVAFRSRCSQRRGNDVPKKKLYEEDNCHEIRRFHFRQIN